MTHETTDLFEAAYMMAEGAQLRDVSRAAYGAEGGGGRGTVLFELEGPTVDKLRENYSRDEAITNVRHFQGMLERAKDVMFALIRAREIQENRLERRKNHGKRERIGV